MPGASAPPRAALAAACCLAWAGPLRIGLLLGPCLLVAAQASAQQVAPPAPPLQTGPGTVSGFVRHPDGPERARGVPVVLYGLSRDGAPGVANTTADERGAFRFEGVANGPDMAYLIGARYRDIPFFGPRVGFEGGASELRVDIEVSEPTADASGVGVAEVIVQLEWAGGHLAVQELHRLRNEAGTVTRITKAQRATLPAPFETRLPAGARDFVSMAGGFEDAVEEEAGRVRFWGPIYPGGQDLRFQYLVPAPAPARNGSELEFTLHFPSGADRLSVLSSLDGPLFEASAGAPILREDEDVDLDGRRFRVRTAEAIARGGSLPLRVVLPETRDDPAALGLARADLWLELDDTQLIVTQELRLRVEGTSRIASAAGDGHDPLLRIPLPAAAEGIDLGPDASALGVAVAGDALVVRGPVPPGESTLRVRYRIAATPEGASLALRFPRAVPLVNVLVADTGVVIESERLHRRRPFTSGTRVYLHREAFNVEPEETLAIELARLKRTGIGSTASMGAALLAMFAAASFVMAPLRRARGAAAEPEESPLALQREAVLQDIRDLDHDFETGKLAEDDHTEMRSALRARAIELLRLERSGAAARVSEATEAPLSPSDASANTAAAAHASPAIGAFCPDCGGRVDASWRFCSHCGRTLERNPEPDA